MEVTVNKKHPCIVSLGYDLEPIAEVKLLDQGHLKLLMWAGNDRDVIKAARTSLSDKTRVTLSDDQALIRYMLRNRHTTPFEIVETWWEWKAPIHVFRQAHRHRTASINEQSARYSEVKDEWYLPAPEQLNFQDPKNKQGRVGLASASTAEEIRTAMTDVGDLSFGTYQALLGKANDAAGTPWRDFVSDEAYGEIKENGGIAREIARNMLPLSTYSTMWWKCDLHNLLHFLGLRADSHAQYEIRQYAEAMADVVRQMVPYTWQAFCDFRRDAISLTACDQQALRLLAATGIIEHNPGVFPTKREFDEFLAKVEKLGLSYLKK